MSKNIKKKRKKKKINKKKINKNKDIYYILIGSLSFLILIFIIIIIVFSIWNNDTKEKIVKVDNINNEILKLKNSYDELNLINKKIINIKKDNDNDNVNNDIDKLTNSIKDLDNKISKYQK